MQYYFSATSRRMHKQGEALPSDAKLVDAASGAMYHAAQSRGEALNYDFIATRVVIGP